MMAGRIEYLPEINQVCEFLPGLPVALFEELLLVFFLHPVHHFRKTFQLVRVAFVIHIVSQLRNAFVEVSSPMPQTSPRHGIALSRRDPR